MKRGFLKALLVSVFATIGFANFASAANINMDSTAKVNICYNWSNVYQSYNFVAWDIGYQYPSGYQSYMAYTGWPATNNLSINYVPGTNTYSYCYDFYFNNQAQSSTSLYFTDSAPRQVVAEFVDPANSYAPNWTNAATTYYATIELRNTVDANNNVTGQEAVLLYVKDANGNKVNKLDFNYTATSVPMDITLSKTVRGDIADTTKYFPFTVNIAGATGTTYTVNGAASGSGSAASCTANTNCTVYLKHGDTIRIGYNGTTSQIPAGTNYSITEGDNTGYTVTYSLAGGAETSGSATGTKTVSATAADNVIAFYNAKNGSPLTGLFTNIWPYLIFAAVSGVSIVVFAKKNHQMKG